MCSALSIDPEILSVTGLDIFPDLHCTPWTSPPSNSSTKKANINSQLPWLWDLYIIFCSAPTATPSIPCSPLDMWSIHSSKMSFFLQRLTGHGTHLSILKISTTNSLTASLWFMAHSTCSKKTSMSSITSTREHTGLNIHNSTRNTKKNTPRIIRLCSEKHMLSICSHLWLSLHTIFSRVSSSPKKKWHTNRKSPSSRLEPEDALGVLSRIATENLNQHERTK